MTRDPVTQPGPEPDGRARRLAVVRAGHRGDPVAARRALADPEPSVRAAAVGALARCRGLDMGTWRAAMRDPAAAVRRRAAELAAEPAADQAAADDGQRAGSVAGTVERELRRALADGDPLVVEAACWALGEHADARAVEELAAVAAGHPDPRCREAAVAALGAIGHPAGLPAVVGALEDRPTVRRRATVALAAFDGPAASAALQRSVADRDWQVREVAEILLEGVWGGSDADDA